MAHPVFKPYSYESEGFEFTEESITVPDKSLSIKDILYRFTQGLPLDEYETPLVYGDDSEQDEDNFEVHPANSFEPLIDVRLSNNERMLRLENELTEARRKRDEQNDANKSGNVNAHQGAEQSAGSVANPQTKEE